MNCNDIKNIPQWLHQRKLGRVRQQPPPSSRELARRLKEEITLEGHTSCVNCLEWNRTGNLLASGSDDRNVIVWEPFRGRKRHVVQTKHRGNIFSVKFMPNSEDTEVATCASDCEVRVTDIYGRTIMHCDKCHIDRVKRLAVHPEEPHLVWSAGEDGYILQYDVRESHKCGSSKPKNPLIDLKTYGQHLAAKCLAINPTRSEMLAVGSNDIYNRLFDRRYINRGQSSNSCTAYFSAGHLLRSNNRSNHLQSFGTTYLAFSPNGSELLASVHAEQVYLFKTYEPWQRFESFDTSLKPLLLDKVLEMALKYEPNKIKTPPSSPQRTKYKPYSHWHELRKRHTSTEMPPEYRRLFKQAEQGLGGDWKPSKEIFDEINELLCKIKSCPDLYRLRASALINRGWRGDYYQALRDCCCALSLKPLDYSTINCLAQVICRLGDKEAARGLLELVETIQQEFGADRELKEATNLLISFKRESSPDSSFDEPVEVYESGERNFQSLSILPRLFAGVELDLAQLQDLTASVSQEQDIEEKQRGSKAFDYTARYCGHCNMNTDIKEANFLGPNGEFVVGGSDDGAFYIWDKQTTNIVKAIAADYQILNCVQPHPNICMLATSGIETTIKLWSASGKKCRDVDAIETRCSQNQEYISVDPLEAMIMMLYPERDI